MYDRKVVRRRRAALAVFVVLSIAILTAYFRESGGGVFHSFQRGPPGAVAPGETAARPGGARTGGDGPERGGEAGARLLRLGGRHGRRQEAEQAAQARGPGPAQ